MKYKKVKPAPKSVFNLADEAKSLYNSFLLSGFTTDQAFDLLMLVLSKRFDRA